MFSVTGTARISMLSKFWAEPSAGKTKSPRAADIVTDIVRFMRTLSGFYRDEESLLMFSASRVWKNTATAISSVVCSPNVTSRGGFEC